MLFTATGTRGARKPVVASYQAGDLAICEMVSIQQASEWGLSKEQPQVTESL
jgi:hypothetical protein